MDPVFVVPSGTSSQRRVLATRRVSLEGPLRSARQGVQFLVPFPTSTSLNLVAIKENFRYLRYVRGLVHMAISLALYGATLSKLTESERCEPVAMDPNEVLRGSASSLTHTLLALRCHAFDFILLLWLCLGTSSRWPIPPMHSNKPLRRKLLATFARLVQGTVQHRCDS